MSSHHQQKVHVLPDNGRGCLAMLTSLSLEQDMGLSRQQDWCRVNCGCNYIPSGNSANMCNNGIEKNVKNNNNKKGENC